MRQQAAGQLTVAQAPYAPRLVPSAEYLRSIPEDVLQKADLEIDVPCTRVRVENAGDTAIRPFAIARLSEVYYADFNKEGIAHTSFEDFFMGKRFTPEELRLAIADRIGPDAVEPLGKFFKLKEDFFGLICRDNVNQLHWPLWNIVGKGSKRFLIPSIVERLPRL